MITCYFGVPGCGKMTLLTKFAIKEFDRIDWAGVGINAASAMASLRLLAGGSIIGVKTIKKKEETIWKQKKVIDNKKNI